MPNSINTLFNFKDVSGPRGDEVSDQTALLLQHPVR